MSLSSASFEYVRSTLRQRSAHHLEDDKAYLVETRLAPVARRHGFESVEAFVLRVRARENEKLLAEIVEAMTINETFFFRDEQPFVVLRDQVLPELVRRRASTRTLNIWSAACSSGQEAYSIAILLCHYFPMLAGWNVRVIASDLSSEMLERARKGRYTDLEVSRGLAPELLAAHFEKHNNHWLVRPEARRLVDFHCINLHGPWPSLPPLDVVLLRNVLIYFHLAAKQQVLERARRALCPDGYLLLGGAETTHNVTDGFQPVSFDQVSFFQPRPHGNVGR
jgi:chemotaxis protein methyltransferase CheR